MTAWTRTNRRTVDQRHEVLPPTWCPRVIASEEPPLRAEGILRSDPSRQTALALVRAIDGARDMVVVMSFLLADEPIQQALLRVAARGVRVYLLLAAETRLDKDVRDDAEFEQDALVQHKEMLKKLAGWVLLRTALGYHAKVVLVDPGTGGSGFLLTSNLTREALTQNEELAVELTQPECAVIFRHLAWAMWEGAEHELLKPGPLLPVRDPSGFFQRPEDALPIVSTLARPGTLREKVLGLIASAKTSIVVASFGWEVDHEAVAALQARAREGVHVSVLARIRPKVMPALLALAQAGAQVLGYPRLHAKALLVDGQDGLVMTANLEKHGLDDSIELGLQLDPKRTMGLAVILKGWVERAPFELRVAPKLGEVTGEAKVWIEKRLEALTVTESEQRSLPAIEAPSVDMLDTESAIPKGKYGLPIPAHELTLTWEVSAPRLQPKAKEIDLKLGKAAKPGDPGVFRESGGRVVVAVRIEDELPRAREIAKLAKAAAIVVRGG